MGTRSGKVFILNINNPEIKEIVYRGSGSIVNLQFSKTGKFLAIASEESEAVVYSREKRAFNRCKKGHDGILTGVFMTSDEQYLLSMGSDGYLNIYNID